MKSESALLITSAQNDLLHPSGGAWGMVKGTVEANEVPSKLGRLAKAARVAGIPVLHSPVSFDYSAMTGFAPLSAIQSIIVENQLFAQGARGVDFIEEARPEEGDIVLEPRQGFSSFWPKLVQPHLERLGIKNLFLAGMLAEACIASHARDAVENGYRPVVVSDAVGATSQEMLEAALRVVALHSHTVKDTDGVLSCWAN